MKRKIHIPTRLINSFLLLLLVINCTEIVQAQEAKIKTLFIYNFVRHIEWPTEYRKGDFIIGILGSSAITAPLQQLSKTKRIGSQPIVVKRINSANEIKKCNVLYLPRSKNKELPAILSKLKSKSTLVITERSGQAKRGAAISFVLRDGKLKFEISKKNILAHKMKVSGSLLKLGIQVDK